MYGDKVYDACFFSECTYPILCAARFYIESFRWEQCFLSNDSRGIPVYTSNMTALPLISGLLASGMNQGAALAFLIRTSNHITGNGCCLGDCTEKNLPDVHFLCLNRSHIFWIIA
jgi:hypothetical protein